MSKLLTLNISLLQWVSIFCVILAICAGLSKNVNKRTRRILVISLIAVAVLTMSDAYTMIYQGEISVVAYLMVRVTNFFVFFTASFAVMAFHMYLCNLLFGGRKLTDKDKGYFRYYAVFIIMSLGIFLTVINLFSGLIYSINDNNEYIRGPLFPLMIALPLIGLSLDMSLLLQFKKTVDKGPFVTSLIFIILPFSACIAEYFVYGLSLISLSVGLSTLILFMDITIENNSNCGKVAMTDVQTGLLNPTGLANRIDRLSGTDEILEFNLYVFSIKRYELISRKFGVDKSDDIIDAYVNRLVEHCDFNEVVAHLSGDCFGALIKKENEEDFLQMLERVTVTVRTEDRIDNVNISAVCGAYEIKGIVQNGRDAIANASLALTNARNVEKKNVCIFNPKMKAEYVESLKLEENIVNALENEEFIPYYQPRVDVRTGKICSAEALARWVDGAEIYNPSQFLPIMEESGLICEFDFYMLERVCRDIETWIKQGIDTPVISVNFSRNNLSDKNLAEHIDKVVKAHNIPRKLIEIEITENNNDEFSMYDLNSFVNRLHLCGYKAALDHFGMGSSALNLLSEIDFDVIKIDKSLVERPYERHRIILGDVIQMAKKIGIEVIAEGVEREEQLDALKLLGCDFAQGYMFDRPMSASLFEKRIKDLEFEYKSAGVC